MKKTLIALAMVAVAGAASALELGVEGGRANGAQDRAVAGVTVNEKLANGVDLQASFHYAPKGDNDQNRFGVTAGYDVAKFGDVTVAVKAGVAYLDNQTSADGWAGTVGVGATYPLTNRVSLVADFRHQVAFQTRVSQFNGNTVTAGVRYSF